MMIYQYTWYFFIYAFLGWCTEVAYKATTIGKFVNRGFLNGPVCPIYGFGMVFVILALTPAAGNLLLVFAGGFVITTALEWLTGFVLEKAFHAKWWDYSNEPFNLCGYTCLKFSILWGLACVLIMDAIQPVIADLVLLLPVLLGKILLVFFSAMLLADAILTVNTVLKLNRQLRHLTELGETMRGISDEIGENLFESVSDLNERNERVRAAIREYRENPEAAKAAAKQKIQEAIEQRGSEMAADILGDFEDYEKKRKEYTELTEEKHFGYGRMTKAFPGLHHTRHQESLERVKEQVRVRAEKAAAARREKKKSH